MIQRDLGTLILIRITPKERSLRVDQKNNAKKIKLLLKILNNSKISCTASKNTLPGFVLCYEFCYFTPLLLVWIF